MDNRPIGILDSGIGGLSVFFEVKKLLPKENFIFLADQANCPYGNRSTKEILDLSQRMVDFLLKKDVKLLIVACNTITVTSIEKLREKYPKLPIVGIVPVIKTASQKSKDGKIGIFSTIATSNSKYQIDLIKKFANNLKVINIGSETLVPLIEKIDFKTIKQVLRKELKEFQAEGIDVLALGCSHFPLVKDQIQKLLPDVLILDSGGAVARRTKQILINNKMLGNIKAKDFYYTTGDKKEFEKVLKVLFKKKSRNIDAIII
jgi:glutamate racemase